MTMKTLALSLIGTLCLASHGYAEELIPHPELPHPAAAVKAYQDHEKTQRNQNAAKAGAAKGATQVRPVNANGRFNNVRRPAGVR